IIRAEQIGTSGTVNFDGVKFIGGYPGTQLGGGIPPPGREDDPSAFTGVGVGLAGDFNGDGKDDLMMTAPGQKWPGARVVFHGTGAGGSAVVPDGLTITINGITFEFDTDADPGRIAAGHIRVNISKSGNNAPAGAEAALRNAMTSISQETLGISSVISRSH